MSHSYSHCGNIEKKRLNPHSHNARPQPPPPNPPPKKKLCDKNDPLALLQ